MKIEWKTVLEIFQQKNVLKNSPKLSTTQFLMFAEFLNHKKHKSSGTDQKKVRQLAKIVLKLVSVK
jgi:hypothetical protein